MESSLDILYTTQLPLIEGMNAQGAYPSQHNDTAEAFQSFIEQLKHCTIYIQEKQTVLYGKKGFLIFPLYFHCIKWWRVGVELMIVIV